MCERRKPGSPIDRRPPAADVADAGRRTHPGHGRLTIMLHLSGATVAVGYGWGDSGDPDEDRSLKHRSKDATRPVPAAPPRCDLLDAHLDLFGTGPGGRLFVTGRGPGGRVVPGKPKPVAEQHLHHGLAPRPAGGAHPGPAALPAGPPPVRPAARRGVHLARPPTASETCLVGDTYPTQRAGQSGSGRDRAGLSTVPLNGRFRWSAAVFASGGGYWIRTSVAFATVLQNAAFGYWVALLPAET